jgi:hypothetical protein
VCAKCAFGGKPARSDQAPGGRRSHLPAGTTPIKEEDPPNTAVLLSDFYRAGNGNDESFKAPMIVSQDDIAPEIEGVQNVWVQGVGCGSAIVHFSSTH